MLKPTFAAALSCLLVAACASNPAADSPELKAAEKAYDDCLRSGAQRFDDGSSDPSEAGITLAGYCLQDFSRYRALSGVSESANEETATRAIIIRRKH